MKFQDPADQALLPVIVSVNPETAQLLSEMAAELDITLDELFSCLAEDAVSDLAKPLSSLADLHIPDKVSGAELKKFLT